jgi:hypothetical protein
MSHVWQLRAAQFLLPKDGAAAAECEDAIGVNLAAGRFAVADGATEAFDARSWAQRLAEGWVATAAPVLTTEAFNSWVAEQGSALHEAWAGRALSWYAEEKAQRGSFAAFVGVQFETGNGTPSWTALALGDSCLIQQRGRRIERALPVSDHRQFTSTPVLVPSRNQWHEAALGQLQVERGSFAPGDVLWLLSDATAEWFLRCAAERDARALARLNNFLAHDRAAETVALFQEQRRARRIKDDDVAIIRITLAGA